MATRTFCDFCGDEGPVSSVSISAIQYDACDKCRSEIVVVLVGWRDERLKTKKQFSAVTKAGPTP